MRFWVSLILAISTSVSAASPVVVKVTPESGLVPLRVRPKVTVEPDPTNRTMCFVWGVNDDKRGSSCQDLEGDQAPRTFFFPERVLDEPGEWFFIARVLQNTDKVNVGIARVRVVGGF